jgi:hypothetical protein
MGCKDHRFFSVLVFEFVDLSNPELICLGGFEYFLWMQ